RFMQITLTTNSVTAVAGMQRNSTAVSSRSRRSHAEREKGRFLRATRCSMRFPPKKKVAAPKADHCFQAQNSSPGFVLRQDGANELSAPVGDGDIIHDAGGKCKGGMLRRKFKCCQGRRNLIYMDGHKFITY